MQKLVFLTISLLYIFNSSAQFYLGSKIGVNHFNFSKIKEYSFKNNGIQWNINSEIRWIRKDIAFDFEFGYMQHKRSKNYFNPQPGSVVQEIDERKFWLFEINLGKRFEMKRKLTLLPSLGFGLLRHDYYWSKLYGLNNSFSVYRKVDSYGSLLYKKIQLEIIYPVLKQILFTSQFGASYVVKPFFISENNDKLYYDFHGFFTYSCGIKYLISKK